MKILIKQVDVFASQIVDYTQENFDIGDQIVIDLRGIGKATATAVTRENSGTLFVFDGIVGDSTMDDMDHFLSNLATKFPRALQKRLNELRLLDASEVFSNCDDPDQWDWLKRSGGVERDKPQLQYFKPYYKRNPKYSFGSSKNRWWLKTNYLVPDYSVFVDSDEAKGGKSSLSFGVRPAFIIEPFSYD